MSGRKRATAEARLLHTEHGGGATPPQPAPQQEQQPEQQLEQTPSPPPPPRNRGGRPRRLSVIATLTCPECGKVFSGNRSNSGVHSNFKRHLATHAQRKPFPCPYCRSGFTTKQNMQRHVAALHANLATPQQRPQAPRQRERRPRGDGGQAAEEAVVVDVNGGEAPAETGEVVVGGRREEDQQRGSAPATSPLAVVSGAVPADEGGRRDGALDTPAGHGAEGEEEEGPQPNSPQAARPLPPFALPTSTAKGAAPRPASSPLCCHFCGKYFAWRSTHAFHERSCPKRVPDPAVRAADSQQPTPPHGADARAGKRSRSPSDSPAPSRSSSSLSASPSTPQVSPPRGKRRRKKRKKRERQHATNLLATVPVLVLPKKTFLCPDCELEVGTRQHLLRHQRYYCPFREDAFADPFADAVEGKRLGMQEVAAHGKGGRAWQRARGEVAILVTSGSDDVNDSDADDDDAREAERLRQRAAQLTAETGLKYYENANESDANESDSRSASEEDGDVVMSVSTGSSGDSDSLVYIPTEDDEGGDGTSEEGLLATSTNDDEYGDDEEERAAWLEQRISLDYKRRHGNRRRQRRILLRRLRAREGGGRAGAVKGTRRGRPEGQSEPGSHPSHPTPPAAAPAPAAPAAPTASVPASMVATTSDKPLGGDGSGKVTPSTTTTTAASLLHSPVPPPALATPPTPPSAVRREAEGQQLQAAVAAAAVAPSAASSPPPPPQLGENPPLAGSGPVVPILTGSLQQRAQALLEARWSRRAASRHTCPFENCMATFASRGQWLQHVKRVHPAEYTASGREERRGNVESQ